MKVLLSILMFSITFIAVSQPRSEELQALNVQWEAACKARGCLTGGQYVNKVGSFGSEACIMATDRNWQTFFDNGNSQLTHFLISQLEDTSTSKIHTCPFFNATNGELAVYSLQNIHKKNWYEFDDFTEYKNKDYTDSENPQAWLQAILSDPKQRGKLAQYWLKQLEK